MLFYIVNRPLDSTVEPRYTNLYCNCIVIIIVIVISVCLWLRPFWKALPQLGRQPRNIGLLRCGMWCCVCVMHSGSNHEA